jgi:hypothetical protein
MSLTPCFFVVFISNSHLNLSKSLGVRHRDFCERVENIFCTRHVDGVENIDMTLNYFINFYSNWKIGLSWVHIPPSIFIHHE